MVGAKIVRKIDGGADIREKRLEDAAVRVDGDGEAVVGSTHDPAAVLDGAHADHAQMLLGGSGTAEPAVIRNVEEELCATGGETAHFARVDCFITDKDTKGMSMGKLAHDVLVSFVEAANVAGYTGDDAVDQRERHIFAKGNEMDLVVDEDTLALRVKEQGAVVGEKSARRDNVGWVYCWLPLDGPYEEWMAETNG